MNEVEKFPFYKEVILHLQKISEFPSFLDKYHYHAVLRTLNMYSIYIARNSSFIKPAHLKRIKEIFRNNKNIFQRYYGKFSHNDIHMNNLIYKPTATGYEPYLVDVEACRVSNQFSDFARCYNRVLLRTARTYFFTNGEIKYFEFDDVYDEILSIYHHDTLAKKMFDVMILADNLMYLYFVLKHQQENKVRQFTEKFFSLTVEKGLEHF